MLIVAHNCVAYLTCTAIINGARSVDEIAAALHRGMFRILKV